MKTQPIIQQNIDQSFQGNVSVEKLFELAIETANEGYKLKAMEIAREALVFAKYKNDYTAVYIHGFLAVLCIDFLKISSARIHIYNAMNRLDVKHFSYDSDYKYLTALLNKLNKTDQKIEILSEPIAA